MADPSSVDREEESSPPPETPGRRDVAPIPGPRRGGGCGPTEVGDVDPEERGTRPQCRGAWAPVKGAWTLRRIVPPAPRGTPGRRDVAPSLDPDEGGVDPEKEGCGPQAWSSGRRNRILGRTEPRPSMSYTSRLQYCGICRRGVTFSLSAANCPERRREAEPRQPPLASAASWPALELPQPPWALGLRPFPTWHLGEQPGQHLDKVSAHVGMLTPAAGPVHLPGRLQAEHAWLEPMTEPRGSHGGPGTSSHSTGSHPARAAPRSRTKRRWLLCCFVSNKVLPCRGAMKN